ncbi:MFS transporter [Sphingobium sp.]|uniref:MFS transporter n=1 Tax=Sphingobium sp. TaxID=1912891 RepID=UPI0028BD691D|nr:MFS transporter [Sphingobium sp.]
MAALIAGSISYSLFSAVSSLFVEPLERQFGWTRGEIAAVHLFGIFIAFANPVLGHIIDRYGVRPVLLVGSVLTASGYGLLAMMQGSLEYYYAVYFFFNLVGLSTTGLAFTRVISGAFSRTRGTALSLGRSSLAISGALMSMILFPVITRFGTAGGYLILGSLILLIALPLIFLWVPSKSQEIKAGRLRTDERGHRIRFLLTRPKVGILCAAAALNYAPVVSILSQMKPLAISKGLDVTMAVGAISMMGIAAAAGALLSGVLVDRFWAPAVAFVLNLAPAIGCLFLVQDHVSPMAFYGAILLLGLGQGAELDIVAYMIAKYFGLASYGTVFGLTSVGIALGVAAGATMIGVSYDHFGSYNIALMVASACFTCAALCYLAMGRYPQPGAVGAPE